MRQLISGTFAYRIHVHLLSDTSMRSHHFRATHSLFSFLISHFSIGNADSTVPPRSSTRYDESGQSVSLFSLKCAIHEHVLMNLADMPLRCLCNLVASSAPDLGRFHDIWIWFSIH